MYGNFFPNFSSIISEKCMVTPNFLLDSSSPCWDLLFPRIHKPHKYIVVLVDKFLNKPDYNEMRRTYAQ